MTSRQFFVPQRLDDGQSKNGYAAIDMTKEFAEKDNASFLARVALDLQAIKKRPKNKLEHARDGSMAIGLIGRYGLFGYGLRRSQEIVRFDRGPSYWSHAFLFHGNLSPDEDRLRGEDSPWLLECAIHPPKSLNDWIYKDGVAPRRVSDYARAEFHWLAECSVPNIAVISIAMTQAEREAIRRAALQPDAARLQYDLLALAGMWFQHLTNTAEVPNPLTQGNPISSSAYVQMAYNAANIDLAPTAIQGTSTPEHFWSLARRLPGRAVYWEEKTKALSQRSIQLWYCVRDPYCLMAPPEVLLEFSLEHIVGNTSG
ncbi:hypothetical protein [Aromatoleum petrolei]|uniref:Uncharacterized protein n=1 Tax=Aromatoleum petrolei TaxID=76116 RepID=A0ABX1MQC4_9RHOO|nr:hypothetical protein [Aromatoleum petrolei]NMF88194.1 hypothetical protein [Aromatoleum petrolei]QTQ38949.1 Uncharacterized protein ToN1_48540 [Aromatoleum petrolei]